MSIELNDSRIQRAIALIWHEAELLDTKDYQAWQELYTPRGEVRHPDRSADRGLRILAEHGLRR